MSKRTNGARTIERKRRTYKQGMTPLLSGVGLGFYGGRTDGRRRGSGARSGWLFISAAGWQPSTVTFGFPSVFVKAGALIDGGI